MTPNTYANTISGTIEKLRSKVEAGKLIQYSLPIGEQELALNELIGKKIQFVYANLINCLYCGNRTKTSFSQGFCYPCMKRLARCDQCIMSPERCHYDQGTCREPSWGEKNCLTGHIVYISNTSNSKIGITRETQIPTRWVDQGAIEALPIVWVSQRKISGLVEVHFKQWMKDKTNWRAMLKNDIELVDLKSLWQDMRKTMDNVVTDIQHQYGIQSIQLLDADVWQGDFPVVTYPTKVVSIGFDKTENIEGVLQGIKGQYLILDNGVLNVRKHSGYSITVNY